MVGHRHTTTATADATFLDTVEREPVELSPISTTAADAPLLATEDAENLQVESRALQSGFVDDPREAVQRRTSWSRR